MAPGLVTLILYPRRPDTHFNLDYYLNKHVPLANEIWGPHGMKFHSVSALPESTGYHLATVLEWTTKDGWDHAQKDERTKEVMRDLEEQNFTNAEAVFLMGDVVA